MKYFILSLKWSKGDTLVWWRPNSAGYTTCLEAAGLYCRKGIDEKSWYYNNGESTLAVPEDVVKGRAVQVVRDEGGNRAAFIKAALICAKAEA